MKPFAVAAWMLFIFCGFAFLWNYQSRPGSKGPAPAAWPKGAAIAPSPGHFNLVLALHPHCPCSNATAEELNKILSQTRTAMQVHVLLFSPAGADAQWSKSTLSDAVAKFPNTTVTIDLNGEQAEKFGALTSGDAELFSPDGRRSSMAEPLPPRTRGRQRGIREHCLEHQRTAWTGAGNTGLRLPNSQSQQQGRCSMNARVEELFQEHQHSIYVRTDRLFAWLMGLQWLGAIAAALWISPRAWNGAESETHAHVYVAIVFGGAIVSLPIALAVFSPGKPLTRHVVAVAQMLMSALIHLTGGRIETHFHVFGSLAFLAFYRDLPVLFSASLIVGVDHYFRGVYFPQSVYAWRWREIGAGWNMSGGCFLKMCFW